MAKKAASPEEKEQLAEARPYAEGMFRSSDDVRSSFISGIDAFTVKPVEYSVINGKAIFEGDILLGSAEEWRRYASSSEVLGSGAGFDQWNGRIRRYSVRRWHHGPTISVA